MVERFNPIGGRLFRYDRRIVINATRATFSGWRDRLIVIVLLLLAVAIARSWLAERAWTSALWTALSLAVVVGAMIGRSIAARLAFHGFDGPLAEDALRAAARRQYCVAWAAIGLVTLSIVAILVRPSMLPGLAGYPVAVLTGYASRHFALPTLLHGKGHLGWSIRASLGRPVAGSIAAAIVLLSFVVARPLGEAGLMAVAGIATLIVALALTLVDDRLVRFRIITGTRSWRIVVPQARALLLFSGIVVPICALAFPPIVAGIVAAIATAALLLMGLRVLMYCLHDKRLADMLVAIIVGVLGLFSFTMTVLLPPIALATLWHLHRRASSRRWMLP